MTRKGKKSAEDVKKAFVRAIELAGLKVDFVQRFKGEVVARQLVIGTAKPEGWPHKSPPIEMHALVDLTGEIGAVDIRCSATDQDSLKNIFGAPKLRDCSCELEDLPETLQAVWAERQVVIDRVKQGGDGSRFVGRWVWQVIGKSDLCL